MHTSHLPDRLFRVDVYQLRALPSGVKTRTKTPRACTRPQLMAHRPAVHAVAPAAVCAALPVCNRKGLARGAFTAHGPQMYTAPPWSWLFAFRSNAMLQTGLFAVPQCAHLENAATRPCRRTVLAQRATRSSKNMAWTQTAVYYRRTDIRTGCEQELAVTEGRHGVDASTYRPY